METENNSEQQKLPIEDKKGIIIDKIKSEVIKDLKDKLKVEVYLVTKNESNWKNLHIRISLIYDKETICEVKDKVGLECLFN